jgi:hypothetical protein
MIDNHKRTLKVSLANWKYSGQDNFAGREAVQIKRPSGFENEKTFTVWICR